MATVLMTPQDVELTARATRLPQLHEHCQADEEESEWSERITPLPFAYPPDDRRMIGRIEVRIPGCLAGALREEAKRELAAERPWEWGHPLDTLPRLIEARVATLATNAAIRAVVREINQAAGEIERCARRAKETQSESWQAAEGEARSRYRELDEAIRGK